MSSICLPSESPSQLKAARGRYRSCFSLTPIVSSLSDRLWLGVTKINIVPRSNLMAAGSFGLLSCA